MGMAIVETGKSSCFISTKLELAACVREKVIEELDATNSYGRLIECIRTMGMPNIDDHGAPREIPADRVSVDEAEKLVEFIEEIRDDEIQHTGKLMSLMRELDENTNVRMMEGAEEI
jgi:hypothetical protein